MLRNTEYVEDLLKNIDSEDIAKTMKILEQCNAIKNNLQAINYSFPIYKLRESGLDSLSNVCHKIFPQQLYCEYTGNLKSNFEENKKDLYNTLGDLIEQYSE